MYEHILLQYIAEGGFIAISQIDIKKTRNDRFVFRYKYTERIHFYDAPCGSKCIPLRKHKHIYKMQDDDDDDAD